ncbi:hypothetical protein [Rhodococcus zopfii]|uniref:hypothetical protein n=1 Tax=Rhodococcus zopfii TaxID=43772 RepID=UPI001114F83D|nr:hypothetical protein [Rhodococcus zopfii]
MSTNRTIFFPVALSIPTTVKGSGVNASDSSKSSSVTRNVSVGFGDTRGVFALLFGASRPFPLGSDTGLDFAPCCDVFLFFDTFWVRVVVEVGPVVVPVFERLGGFDLVRVVVPGAIRSRATNSD